MDGPPATGTIRLLLAGDVMTGRGIDQILPQPLPPVLYEPWVRDAREYVRLAESAHGSIPRPVLPAYPWGDALAALQALAPDLRIVNLETAITTCDTPWADKDIHYRMNPAHVELLAAARITACSLANNHVLDWSRAGLLDTLAALRRAGIASAGAGADAVQAEQPARLPLPGGARVLLFAWALPDSGVLPGWAAGPGRPGVALLPDLGAGSAQQVLRAVERHRQPGDVVVVSLHWGANWVPRLPEAQRRFAHRLIDLGAADVVHGHSAHHPLPIELHAGKLVLHGCGDLLNDYEGIVAPGHLRSDVACAYAATLDRGDGRLRALQVLPFQLRRLRLEHAGAQALAWLQRHVADDSAALGLPLRLEPGAPPCLTWRAA
jgi:poly-gamma-glutamate synthesis protein (capsule biosynthesis protein)